MHKGRPVPTHAAKGRRLRRGGGGVPRKYLVQILRLLEDDDTGCLGVKRIVVSEPDTRARMKLRTAASRSHDGQSVLAGIVWD